MSDQILSLDLVEFVWNLVTNMHKSGHSKYLDFRRLKFDENSGHKHDENGDAVERAHPSERRIYVELLQHVDFLQHVEFLKHVEIHLKGGDTWNFYSTWNFSKKRVNPSERRHVEFLKHI